MPLIDLLRPDQRAALRRLRKRIGNRENMRRYRAEYRDRKLCAGVDLPIEAGTCGRMIDRRFERCIHCFNRRRWLLNHAMTPYEIAVTGRLADEIEHDAAADEREHVPYTGAVVPLLDAIDDLFSPGDPCLRW